MLETCLILTQISKPRFLFYPMKTGALKTDNHKCMGSNSHNLLPPHNMGQLWQILKDQVCISQGTPTIISPLWNFNLCSCNVSSISSQSWQFKSGVFAFYIQTPMNQMETCKHFVLARDELRAKQATLSSHSVFTSAWNLQTSLYISQDNNIVIENKPLSFLLDILCTNIRLTLLPVSSILKVT